MKRIWDGQQRWEGMYEKGLCQTKRKEMVAVRGGIRRRIRDIY